MSEKDASMKSSSSCGFPRAGNASAIIFEMRSGLPSPSDAGKGDGRPGAGGEFSGSSRLCAPRSRTHKIPLSNRSGVLPPTITTIHSRLGLKGASISSHCARLSVHQCRVRYLGMFSGPQNIAR
jgi:hypothetical protein